MTAPAHRLWVAERVRPVGPGRRLRDEMLVIGRQRRGHVLAVSSELLRIGCWDELLRSKGLRACQQWNERKKFWPIGQD